MTRSKRLWIGFGLGMALAGFSSSFGVWFCGNEWFKADLRLWRGLGLVRMFKMLVTRTAECFREQLDSMDLP